MHGSIASRKRPLTATSAPQVHKANSLEHMRPRRRPPSAAPKRTAPQIPIIPGLTQPRRRPQSAAARFYSGPPPLEFPNGKSLRQKTIDGESGEGPAMKGVTTYPYSRSQLMYLADFRCLVAGTITHPYMATTGFNSASVPHNLLAGALRMPVRACAAAASCLDRALRRWRPRGRLQL